MVWNGKTQSADMIMDISFSHLLQWQQAQTQVPSTSSKDFQNLDRLRKWQKPRQGWLKINTDAAIFTELNNTGFGWVLRDHEGRMMAAPTHSIPGLVDPCAAEALGIREVLSWIKNRGLSKIVVESDALVVVNAINGSTPDFYIFGLIVEDCCSLRKEVPSLNFVFVRRFENQVAH